jgi:uncharacterized protein
MIEFDAAKSEKNFEDRGFDFAYAARIFDGMVITTDSARGDEQRFKSTGIIDGKFYTVIYTWRRGNRRIISARRARRQEIEDYGP